MKADDISRIETSLKITLPASYRRVLEAFPLPAYVGNVDTAVWDDADALIAYNQRLRSGEAGVTPWPAHFYALGRDQGGCSQALDLRTGELWWADRSHIDGPTSEKHPETFDEWVASYFDGLREDLAGEGGDPSGTPQRRAEFKARAAAESARFGGRLLLVTLVIAAIAVIWRLWRS